MEQRLTPAIATQPSLEMQVLTEVGEVRSMVRELTIKLLGDATIESHNGRLPALEATVKTLTERVTRLEQKMLWYVGLATGAGFVIGTMLHLLVK